jgi:hypothetical protein
MKQVWFVETLDSSESPVLFATKMAAEMYARELFPDVASDVRYARVKYRSVWEESDMIERASK